MTVPQPRQRLRPAISPHHTSPLAWRPLTDAECAFLAPYFRRGNLGRPMFDLRARLDAIFWAVTHDGYWRHLPPELGPWDSASRQFRRWAHRGIWTQLLKDCAGPSAPPILRALRHWLCRAFRRAWRILGIEGIRLARRLGLHSALRGPIWMVPDPDLSDQLFPRIRDALRAAIGQPWLRETLQAGIAFHRLVGGRPWIPQWLAPP
jgi:transposase